MKTFMRLNCTPLPERPGHDEIWRAMPTTDPRIDAYIAKSADFAQPILAHLRQVVHAACPDTEETIKWGMPHFMYGGKILAHSRRIAASASGTTWPKPARAARPWASSAALLR
jgi:hypothetical protein